MWDKLLVAAIVLAALALAAYRLWRVLTGRSRCACLPNGRCPLSKRCRGLNTTDQRSART